MRRRTLFGLIVVPVVALATGAAAITAKQARAAGFGQAAEKGAAA